MAEQGGSTHINLVRLRDLLVKHAVSDDLRVWCFDLGESYESIVGPNDKLPIAVINVITYFNARGRIDELIARAQNTFPNATWSLITLQRKGITSSLNVTLQDATLAASATVSRRPGPLRVFLCHTKEDKRIVRDLYRQLKEAGFDPWLDEEKLLPGQKWQVEIPKAIQASDVVLACVSKNSVTSNGFVKRELEFALDIADKLPDDAVFIIPARLQKCEFPERLGALHAVDLYTAKGQERLMNALRERAKVLGAAASPLEIIRAYSIQPSTLVISSKYNPLVINLPLLNFRMEFVNVPAGPFLMGSDKAKDKDANNNELPQHILTLNAFQIGKYPVTNTQYAIYANSNSVSFEIPKGKENHPVVQVGWHEAMDFCRWLSGASGRNVTLPSEAEWEKAARGEDGRIWPWGNTHHKGKANMGAYIGFGDTTPVGRYSAKGGDSPYGCADMAGNVGEWTRSLWGNDSSRPTYRYPYFYRLTQRENVSASDRVARVVRGGSSKEPVQFARCACRSNMEPNTSVDIYGFRCYIVS